MLPALRLSSLPAPAPLAALAPEGNWLTAQQFAELAGIADANGRSALAKGAWRGNTLNVRTVASQGGKSGTRYEVYAPSLPHALYAKWLTAQAGETLPQAPSVTLTLSVVTCDPTAAKRGAKAMWVLGIIRPIIGLAKNSPERAAAIADVLAREHTRQDGKAVRLGKSQLYEWLKRYETEHVHGLKPRQRGDLNTRRVLVTREWDASCPLDEGSQQAIAEALEDYVRSLWASGAAGWNVIQKFASLKLEEMSKGAGWSAPTMELKPACRVSRAFVEKFRKSSLLAVADKDAKKFFDVHIPRIRRSRANLKPMDVVVGDVHPIDIAIHRPDGSVAYPRAICWHDVATNRLYVCLVLLEKGEGVKQVHVASSFAAMCAVWGLPLTLYLDNGSEYSWHEMMAAFTEISRLTQTLQRQFVVGEMPGSGDVRELIDEGRQVVRARPYNAPAKPIEGLFSVIEGTVLSMMPGWVGGERMRQKTHNVGKAPMPYPGTWEDFHADFETAMGFYHRSPQNGTMGGLSPAQAYQTHIDAGWTRTHVEERALLLAFAEEDTRKIQGGYLMWDGTEYYDDALLTHTGQTLTVRVSRHDPRYAFVFSTERALICAAGVAPVYGFMDSEGAKEQARRRKVLMRYVAELRENCCRLDLVAEMRKWVAANGPMPEAQIGATVASSDAARQMVAALVAKQDAELAETESTKAAQVHDSKRLSQWSSPDETDRYLAAVDFADEEVCGTSLAGHGTQFETEASGSIHD
ncbi:MAG: Mu transposase C-terminal domain-containing protein [Rhodocyclaceae bacterium]|nr:Mu transposase C-terminal domain-containing protein [Rhodocyclaceae bacterium]